MAQLNFDNFIKPYSPAPDAADDIANPKPTPDHAEDKYLDWRLIQEYTGSKSPGSVGFSQDGGRANLKYVIGNQFLDRYCIYFTGSAEPFPLEANNGSFLPKYSGINRTLPIAHPRYPWMFASGIESVQGTTFVKASDLSSQGVLPAGNEGFIAPKYPTYGEYQDYDVTVAFTGRNYHTLPNSTIYYDSLGQNNKLIYYFPSSDYAYIGTTFTAIWPEWNRFSFTRIEPRSEYLTAEKNTFFFYDPTVDKLKSINGHVPTIPGNIKIPYPSQSITVQWFNVPYSYITGEGAYDKEGKLTTTTPIQIGLNTVNQYEFLGKKAGTLLFEGVKVVSIGTRPFPEYVEFPVGSGKYTFRFIRVCDLELSFVYRDPPAGVKYESLLKGKSPYIEGGNNADVLGQGGILQGNNVLAGHNLLPNARNGKYYAGVYSKKIANVGVPQPDLYNPDFKAQAVLYPSFPHQLLFTNPAWSCPRLVGIGRHN